MGSKKMSLAEQFPHIQNLADTHGLYALMQAYLSWLRHHNYSEQTIAGRELFLCGFKARSEALRDVCRRNLFAVLGGDRRIAFAHAPGGLDQGARRVKKNRFNRHGEMWSG